MMPLYLLLQSEAVKETASFWGLIMVIFGIVTLIAGSVLIIISARRKEALESAERLLKLKDDEIKTLTKDRDEAREKLADLDAEYKAIVGINMQELQRWWASKIRRDAEFGDMQDDNDTLRRRLQERNNNQ